MSGESEELHDVEFLEADGTTKTVTVDSGETILDAARREDVDLRWGCTDGECTSCTSRLLEGDVTWLSEPKVIDDDRLGEYVSLCLTRPASDCRIQVGDDVLVDSFPRLWSNLDTEE